MRPDEPHARLLCAAVAPGSAADRAARVSLAGVAPERLFRLAADHHVVPLVDEVLARVPDGDPELGDALADVSRRTAARNLRLSAALVDVDEALSARGVAVLAFKGPTLARIAYGELSRRQFADLDLLVPPRALGDVARVLADRDFRTDADVEHVYAAARAGVRTLPTMLHFHKPDEGVAVDVHTELTRPGLSLRFDVAALFERARAVTLAGRAVRTLSAEDLVVYLAVHGADDGWERLRSVADLAWLLRAEAGLDADAVARRAAAMGARRMVRVALGLVEGLLGVEVPPLRGAIGDDEASRRLVARCAARLFRPVRAAGAYADRSALHLALRDRWRDRARYVAALPTDMALADFTTAALPPRWFALYRPLRAVRLARRYAGRR